ncbi:MAG: hypothetical protein ACMXYC_01925 [Candidatus Woesearchaeota archaeon]
MSQLAQSTVEKLAQCNGNLHPTIHQIIKREASYPETNTWGQRNIYRLPNNKTLWESSLALEERIQKGSNGIPQEDKDRILQALLEVQKQMFPLRGRIHALKNKNTATTHTPYPYTANQPPITPQHETISYVAQQLPKVLAPLLKDTYSVQTQQDAQTIDKLLTITKSLNDEVITSNETNDLQYDNSDFTAIIRTLSKKLQAYEPQINEEKTEIEQTLEPILSDDFAIASHQEYKEIEYIKRRLADKQEYKPTIKALDKKLRTYDPQIEQKATGIPQHPTLEDFVTQQPDTLQKRVSYLTKIAHEQFDTYSARQKEAFYTRITSLLEDAQTYQPATPDEHYTYNRYKSHLQNIQKKLQPPQTKPQEPQTLYQKAKATFKSWFTKK